MRHHQGIAVSAGRGGLFAAAALLCGCAAMLQGRAQPQQTARDPPGAAPQATGRPELLE